MAGRRRVVVIGGSGNVGTAVLRRFAEEGDVDVVGVSRRVPPSTGPYATAKSWHPVDVGAPDAVSHLKRAFKGADAVVHLAWGFQPTRDTDHLRRVGVGGSARVLDAALASGVPHLVHMSSVGAYATKIDDVPVDESFPTTGVPTSVYSGHKAEAEAHLDMFERDHPDEIRIARTRPGFVLQADAGAALTRYGLPAYLPSRVLAHLPVLPLDAKLLIPVVHASDVAAAITAIVGGQVAGAFNLAADDALSRDDIARLLGARPLPLSASVVHAAIDWTWRLRLQPLDAGWIDLAFAVPLMDTSRARDVLGWAPQVRAEDALTETVAAMARGHGIAGPVLRPRSAVDELRRLVRQGPITRRLLP